MERKKILLVEDEVKLARFVELELQYEGYDVTVCHDGREGMNQIMDNLFDMILLDLMLPGLTGIEICRRVRKFSQVPIIMLTAKDEIMDKVAGLDSGADDYLPKPFDNREFIARVRALTRRGGEYKPTALTAGNVTLDCSTFELKCGSSCIRLGNREFQMLELLMRQEGRLISTEQFMEHIWGYDSEAEINVVWAYISYLRRKLEAVGANVRIAAHRGQGYLLEETT